MSPAAPVVLDATAAVSVSKLASVYKAGAFPTSSGADTKKEIEPDAKPSAGTVSALASQFKATKFLTPVEAMVQAAGNLNAVSSHGPWTISTVGRYERESKGGKTVVFQDMKRYNLEYVGDEKINNKGAFTYSNGDRYDGEWKDNRHHGKGVMQYDNGDRYTGDWANDLPHGKGVKSSRSGAKYDGDWDCDKRHGQVSACHISKLKCMTH